jgi:hypothetical protein
MLYYKLLVDDIPANKIETIAKSVLQSFHHSVVVDKINLPKKSCASYLRQQELKTLCHVHKATVLSEIAHKKDGLLLNTDGTTKNQVKLGGVVANSMVLV